MRALSLCVLVLSVAALAADATPARACSCAVPDPRSALAAADGAFVGTLVSRRETSDLRAVLTFEVEQALKGSLGDRVEVVTARDSAGCGLELPVGTRTGLVLDRRDGAWHGHLCAQFAPADLLAAVQPLPAPNGKGTVALLLGGRFGPARLLALDRRGRTLAYGMGGGNTTELSVCPGRVRAVERFYSDAGASLIAVRDLRTLRVVRRQRLTFSPLDVPYGLRCLDQTASQVGLFVSGVPPGDRNRARLVLVTPQRAKTIWRGAAFFASLTGRVAYVNSLRGNATRLLAVDLRTGAARDLGRLPDGTYPLVPNARGTRLAGIASDGTDPPRLVSVSLERHPATVRSVPLRGEIAQNGLFWLPEGRLAYFGSGEVRVYSTALRISRRIAGWNAGGTALVGSTAFGIGWDGRLVRAELPSGPVRVVRRLPSPTARVIVAA